MAISASPGCPGRIVTTAPVLVPESAQEPSSNTAAVLTLGAPGTGVSWALGGVYGGYDAAPTAGALSIAWVSTGTTTTTVTIPVTSAGPLPHLFSPALRFPPNGAVTITLAAGGGGVSGKIHANAWTEKAGF